MLIGLTGPAGVGKDTVAAVLKSMGWYQYAFAKPMKEMLAVVGLHEPPTREAKEAELPGLGFSYRKAAQRLGTEWARELHQDFWLMVAEKQIAFYPKVVISDVRFENEAAWLRNMGGTIVHIIGRRTTVQGEEALHVSENGIMQRPQDKILENSGSLSLLAVNINTLLTGMGAWSK